MRTIIACMCLGLFACGGAEALGVPGEDAPACEATPIASVTGCTTQPLPLNLLPYPTPAEALTVYLDGQAIPRDDWTLTNGGHTLTLVCDGLPQDATWRLVSVSVGCVVE
jgi:hypothetical protein